MNARAERSCRACGCTEHVPCFDAARGQGCHWVETDLCNVCAAAIVNVAKNLMKQVIDNPFALSVDPVGSRHGFAAALSITGRVDLQQLVGAVIRGLREDAR